MKNASFIRFTHHKYDLIFTTPMGSSPLSLLSPLCRQFDSWVRYKGESISGQDHFNFYKWLSFEFAAPILDLPSQNRAHITHLGNSSPFCSI